jgi:hypothetical protein
MHGLETIIARNAEKVAQMLASEAAKSATLRIIVKGNEYEVEQAASARGVPFAFVETNRAGQTLCDVSAEHSEKVMAWFCESGTEAPFPIGSLLFFSELPKTAEQYGPRKFAFLTEAEDARERANG